MPKGRNSDGVTNRTTTEAREVNAGWGNRHYSDAGPNYNLGVIHTDIYLHHEMAKFINTGPHDSDESCYNGALLYTLFSAIFRESIKLLGQHASLRRTNV